MPLLGAQCRGEGPTSEQAAKAIGVGRAPLYHWEKEPEPKNRRPRTPRISYDLNSVIVLTAASPLPQLVTSSRIALAKLGETRLIPRSDLDARRACANR